MLEKYVGREVSAQAIMPLYDALIADGCDPAALPSAQYFRESVTRLPWSQALMMLQLAERRLDEAALKAIGARGLQAERMAQRVRWSQRLLTLEDTFRLVIYPHSDVDYACALAAVEAEPGDIRVTVVMEDGYTASRAFFLIMLGALEAFLDQAAPPARAIKAESGRDALSYRVTYRDQPGFWTPLKRLLSNALCRIYGLYSHDAIRDALAERALEVQRVRLAKTATDATARAQQDLLEDALALAGAVLMEFGPGNRLEQLHGPVERLTGYSPTAIRIDPAGLFADQSAIALAGLEPLAAGTATLRWRHRKGQSFPVAVTVAHLDAGRWRLLASPAAETGSLEAEIAVPEAPQTAAPDPVRQGNLVFVDDNALSCRIGKGILEHAGYSVVTSPSGAEALDYLGSQRADMVILDVHMPEMGGDEVYDVLRSRQDDVPVIFLTGDPQDLATRYPRVPILRKPYRAEELLQAVAGAGR